MKCRVLDDKCGIKWLEGSILAGSIMDDHKTETRSMIAQNFNFGNQERLIKNLSQGC